MRSRDRAGDGAARPTLARAARADAAGGGVCPESAKRRVDVTVMGLSLSVRTDREDAWVHALVGQVNRRADELRRVARNASAQQLAVLLALNLAEELQAERERAKAREQELEGELVHVAGSALAQVQAALAVLDEVDDEDVDQEVDETVGAEA